MSALDQIAQVVADNPVSSPVITKAIDELRQRVDALEAGQIVLKPVAKRGITIRVSGVCVCPGAPDTGGNCSVCGRPKR